MKPILGTQLNKGHTLASGLVGYWLMNEGCGNIVGDLSGNSNNGLATGAAWVGSEEGYAMNFAAATQYVDLGTVAANLIGTYNWSIIVEAASDSFTSTPAAFAINGTDDLIIYPYDSQNTSFRVFWRTKNIPTMSAAHALAGTGMNQFVITCSAIDDIRLYVNGELGSTSDNSDAAGTFEGNAYIGVFAPSSQGFGKDIRSASLYNRALSQGEIQSLYQDPYQMFKTGELDLLVAATSAASAPGTPSIPVIMNNIRRRK